MYQPIKAWTKRDRKISMNGYVLIMVPEHPKNFMGWYYEHRLVIEKQLNRLIDDWETIHHINEDKTDNRAPSNKLRESSEERPSKDLSFMSFSQTLI